MKLLGSQGEIILDLGWALNPMTSVLIRRSETQRDTGMPCEDTRRNCCDVSTSQERPRIAGDHQKLEEARRILLRYLGKCDPALISDFRPSER